jgi:hypothetical protein
MSDAADPSGGDAGGGGSAAVGGDSGRAGSGSGSGSGWGADATAAAVGLVGGTAIPVVQWVLWEWCIDGPLEVPAADGRLEAEMALFVAIGVAVPAGGVALLYRDDPLSGAVGAAATVAVSLVLPSLVAIPWWFGPGLVGAALLLGAVAAMESLDARPGTAG